jgi:hypothetical protein
MTEHPNAVAMRRNFEAWNSGRLDVLSEGSAEDAVLHFAGVEYALSLTEFVSA